MQQSDIRLEGKLVNDIHGRQDFRRGTHSGRENNRLISLRYVLDEREMSKLEARNLVSTRIKSFHETDRALAEYRCKYFDAANVASIIKYTFHPCIRCVSFGIEFIEIPSLPRAFFDEEILTPMIHSDTIRSVCL